MLDQARRDPERRVQKALDVETVVEVVEAMIRRPRPRRTAAAAGLGLGLGLAGLGLGLGFDTASQKPQALF